MTQTEYVEAEPNVPGLNIREALHAVIDPELGIDIVNLGMVYRIAVNHGHVQVEMTLTTPGCPLHGSIRADVERVLLQVPGVGTVPELVSRNLSRLALAGAVGLEGRTVVQLDARQLQQMAGSVSR